MCAWTLRSYTTLPSFSTCSPPTVKSINCSGWRTTFQCALATSRSTSRFTLFTAPHTTFYSVDHSIFSPKASLETLRTRTRQSQYLIPTLVVVRLFQPPLEVVLDALFKERVFRPR